MHKQKLRLISFRFTDITSIPVVEFKINGIKLNAVIDTGSEITMFDVGLSSYILCPEQKEDGEASITMLDGEKKLKAIRSDVHLLLGGKELDVLGHFMDLSSLAGHFNGNVIHAVFGADLLSKYNIVVDFENNNMTMF